MTPLSAGDDLVALRVERLLLDLSEAASQLAAVTAANKALMDERGSIIATKREQLAALTEERDLALSAEDAAKDCFWAVYPTYCKTIGHGISTEAARTSLSARILELEQSLQRKQDLLDAVVSFVHRWAWDKEGTQTTDAERLDVIKHYPPIAALATI